MAYNAEAFDFLLPGVMDLEQVQARRVIYDRKYDLTIPNKQALGDSNLVRGLNRFWSPVEKDLHTVQVDPFQSVEITFCCVYAPGPKAIDLPFVITYRQVFMPFVCEKNWSDCDFPYRAPKALLHTEGDRVARLRRVIVRLLPDFSVPLFWTEDRMKDFPLHESGFEEPAPQFIQNMHSATNSCEVPPSTKFTALDVELLERELDPESRTLLKPFEYTNLAASVTSVKHRFTSEEDGYYLNHGYFDKTVGIARAIEIILGDGDRRVIRLDYPVAVDGEYIHTPLNLKYNHRHMQYRKHLFVYQDEESVNLLHDLMAKKI